jgi:RimJ/RimL family protein N-acetyltransferase
VKSLEEIWPLFGLQVVAGPLNLRVVRDADIPSLVELAERGIHEPDAMPFLFPWSVAPHDELCRNMATHYWESRSRISPQRWSLELVVRWNSTIVGMQDYSTRNSLVTRTGETGSWLGRDFQGRGIGTAMRQAVCALVFDYLGAEEVTSAAFLDNPASQAVSTKVGYRPNGRTRETRRDDELAISQQLVLTPADLVRGEHELEVSGAKPVRRFLGLDE